MATSGALEAIAASLVSFDGLVGSLEGFLGGEGLTFFQNTPKLSLLLSWHHSGFCVHNSVTVPAGDGRALEALARHCLRPPVSLARLRWAPGSPFVQLLAGDDQPALYLPGQPRALRSPSPAFDDWRAPNGRRRAPIPRASEGGGRIGRVSGVSRVDWAGAGH